MRTALRYLCLAFISWAVSMPAAANPTIVGNAADERCALAHEMASKVFRSNSFGMNWPIPAPASKTMAMVLQQSDADISGGEAIAVDPSHFERVSLGEGYSTAVFWGKHIAAGKRLAIVASPRGWRGDWYAVHLVEPHVRTTDFADQLKTSLDSGDSRLDPILGDGRWNPPLVLVNVRSGEYWIIDRGEPYDIMPAWQVIGLINGKPTNPCRIDFGYSKSRGLAAMPRAVRQLADMLDEALGPGNDEGTLRPTARIRLEVERGWANAGLRPWALATEPFNTRSEVDGGLKAWAKANGRRAIVLRRIQGLYPAAKLALARHYASRGGQISASGPDQDVLDRMFRSYFVFSKNSMKD